MKKAYESPKAEKAVFNYSDAVVASGNGCHWEEKHGWNDSTCHGSEWDGEWVGNQGT